MNSLNETSQQSPVTNSHKISLTHIKSDKSITELLESNTISKFTIFDDGVVLLTSNHNNKHKYKNHRIVISHKQDASEIVQVIKIDGDEEAILDEKIISATKTTIDNSVALSWGEELFTYFTIKTLTNEVRIVFRSCNNDRWSPLEVDVYYSLCDEIC